MLLKSNSVMLIGERNRNNVVWTQIYETTQSMKEEDLRSILKDVKSHIARKDVNSGSARKFKDGKLIFYESQNTGNDKMSKIYCLYTLDPEMGSIIKSAIESVAERGGGNNVYSAKRFFSETIDIVEKPELLDAAPIDNQNVLQGLNQLYPNISDVNKLGQLISVLSNSDKLDWETLDKIYMFVYESLQSLLEGNFDLDTDEFLDAGYAVARSYEQHQNFTLGLELLKYLTLVAAMNQRNDLEASCKLRIAEIYKKYFPPSGEFILEELSNFSEIHLVESPKPEREIYYSLLGYAHSIDGNHVSAMKFYRLAIDEAGVNISSPKWIAEAYNYLGNRAMLDFKYSQAARLYMTASVISLIEGDIVQSDNYNDNVSRAELEISDLYIKSGLMLRMEENDDDAEYRTWMALRHVIRANTHISIQSQGEILEKSHEIIRQAQVILNLKEANTSKFLENLKKMLTPIEVESLTPKRVEIRFEALEQVVESYITIPPPTFMLITRDGQLLLMGEVDKIQWLESELKGIMLGGILVAIMSLISEVSGKTSLRTVDAGNFKIMIETSENGVAALLVDRDLQEFRSALQTILKYIEKNYSDQVKFWNGRVSTFDNLKQTIISILAKAY